MLEVFIASPPPDRPEYMIKTEALRVVRYTTRGPIKIENELVKFDACYKSEDDDQIHTCELNFPLDRLVEIRQSKSFYWGSKP